MAAQRILTGIVRDGVVVPDNQSDLPEGAHVHILLSDYAEASQLMHEFTAWDLAGTEGWKLIDQWEQEDNVESW
jgi:hypothetical protein